MAGIVSEEIEVKVPPSEAWKLYGTLKFEDIVCEALTGFVSKIDVVHGDGGVGTIIHVFFTPGSGKVDGYKEKFVMVDDVKRVKQAEVVEGGYLDLGFTYYRMRFEVVEKEGSKEECTTRATIEYEAKDEEVAAALVSIQPMLVIMHAAAKHLVENYKK